MQDIANRYVLLLSPWTALTIVQDVQLVSGCNDYYTIFVLTSHSPDFNEIMPAIYSRFMEKEARQWRQIYKVRSTTIYKLSW